MIQNKTRQHKENLKTTIFFKEEFCLEKSFIQMVVMIVNSTFNHSFTRKVSGNKAANEVWRLNLWCRRNVCAC